MNRYKTIQCYDGETMAQTEDEYEQCKESDNAMPHNKSGVADWIWQFAENKEQAIAQHNAKQDQFSTDMEAGKPEKDTY